MSTPSEDETSRRSEHPVPTVLILCTGNSCRSQMAEALLRESAPDAVEVHSAGSKPSGFVHPLAIRVMQEIGIPLDGHRSKSLDEFLQPGHAVDVVITVCGDADASCPHFPGAVERLHWPFADPARAEGDEEAVLEQFRASRDALRARFSAYGAGLRHGALRLGGRDPSR